MGLISSVADTVGGAIDSAADAIGVPEGVQDVFQTGGPTGVTEIVEQGADALGAGGVADAAAAVQNRTSPGSGDDPMPQTTRRDSTGAQMGGEIDIPGLGSFGGSVGTSTVTETGGQNQGGNLPMQGGFQGAIMMEMLEDAIGSQDGRAVLEAMTSGALQNGVIQRPANVQTPRGTRNVSPPGFRTVYLGGDDDADAYAVFKPLAKSLGLIGRESPRTFREKLDDTTRQFLKHRNEFEDLAQKLGLKTSNRKSGPSR